jgi:hypothetical protein
MNFLLLGIRLSFIKNKGLPGVSPVHSPPPPPVRHCPTGLFPSIFPTESLCFFFLFQYFPHAIVISFTAHWPWLDRLKSTLWTLRRWIKGSCNFFNCSFYYRSLGPRCFLGEYVGSLILFRLPGNTLISHETEHFRRHSIYLLYSTCGTERLASLPVGCVYCDLWTLSPNRV